MSGEGGPKPSLGATLLQRGWAQGVLFQGPSLTFNWNALGDDADGRPTKALSRPRKSKECWVLITQTCDVARDDDEPYVEALLCRTGLNLNAGFWARAARNSARYFVIDLERGIVAQAKYRIQIAKEVLLAVGPEPWPSSPWRRERFIEWLARRYDRPALPDPLVDSLQRPVAALLEHLSQEEPGAVEAFNRVVHEIRLSRPATDVPPFRVELLMLLTSEEDQISAAEADTVDRVKDLIRQEVDPQVVRLVGIREVLEEEISLAEYRATDRLYLDYHTYQGEETTGAEPLTVR